MTEPTAGDLARFLEANPGPHQLGRFTVEHKGTFKLGETWTTALAEGTGQPTNQTATGSPSGGPEPLEGTE